MNFPVVTAITGVALALLQTFLGFAVGFKRLKYNTGIGDGGHEALARKIRVHGNLTENAPIFLILLTFLELAGTNRLTITIIGTIFVVSRIIHAYALDLTASTANPLRAVGNLGSNLSLIITAGMIVHQILSGTYYQALP